MGKLAFRMVLFGRQELASGNARNIQGRRPGRLAGQLQRAAAAETADRQRVGSRLAARAVEQLAFTAGAVRSGAGIRGQR